MILLSTQIKLHKARGTFFRVSWPQTEVHGSIILAYSEDFATKAQAMKASTRFDAIGLKPEKIEELPAASLFQHLPA